MQAITFLRVRCVQARYPALSLLSFAQLHLPLYDFLQLRLINSLQDFLAPVRSLQNGIIKLLPVSFNWNAVSTFFLQFFHEFASNDAPKTCCLKALGFGGMLSIDHPPWVNNAYIVRVSFDDWEGDTTLFQLYNFITANFSFHTWFPNGV